jgi:Ca2+-transporting ATPase
MVLVLHAKVPGRTRLKILDLFQAPAIKQHIEKQLARLPGIQKVSANHRTGNVLVHHSPELTLPWIVDTIKSALEKFSVSPMLPAASPLGRHPDDAFDLVATMPVHCPEMLSSEGLKKTIRRLLPVPDRPPEAIWHMVSIEDALDCFGVRPEDGLAEQVASDRLRQYGSNTIPQMNMRSRWRIFVGQFKSLPVALLGVAAGISIFTGGLLDAAVIMGVVAANAVIGYVTESAAEKTIHSLKERSETVARVIRDGQILEISSSDVALGDILALRPGSMVPADARVIKATRLKIDESMLTGESMPVEKLPARLLESDRPLADQLNMVFMGTQVTGGQGLAVVVATGRRTQLGYLQALLDETVSPPTPIEEQLARVGDQLVLTCLAISAVVFGLGWLRGQSLLVNLRNAIALAAAAVPEGLPAAATSTFALGIHRMREHNVLIRNLEAIETLGAVQVVCLDKTGTITENRMSAVKVAVGNRMLDISAGQILEDGRPTNPLEIQELRRMVEVCVLCNESEINGGDPANGWCLNGSPTENALLDLAFTSGVDAPVLRKTYTQQNMNHRAEDRPFMSTIHVDAEGARLCSIKGSPAEVLELCQYRMVNGRKMKLTAKTRQNILAANQAMAREAMRVLGAAYSDCTDEVADPVESELIWLGLVGLADPIREGVPELIKAFHRAGIDTIMITGDQTPTALAVAEKLGLSRNGPLKVMDSRELSTLDRDELIERVKDVHVFSRVNPSHKLSIVRALQDAGQVVAMTGDGINDGPALKAAEVGVAMGRNGADAARDVADVVLGEDDLETLITALRDGRTTSANIKKSVHFFLSTNMTEIMVILGGLAIGIVSPLNTMQLLWINIISDIFPGLALSLEEPEPGVLERPPRDPQKPLFTGQDWGRMAKESGVISASTLGVFGYGLARHGAAGATSLAFQTLTIAQLLHVLSCRSETRRLRGGRRLPPNPYVGWALGGSLVVQALTMFVPFLRSFLGLAALHPTDFGVIAAGAVLPLFVNEATKPSGKPRRVKPVDRVAEEPLMSAA